MKTNIPRGCFARDMAEREQSGKAKKLLKGAVKDLVVVLVGEAEREETRELARVVPHGEIRAEQ